MNIAIFRNIYFALSMKNEVKLISYVILVICMIPIMLVTILTQAGIDVVSGALINENLQTSQVEIKDPLTGQVVETVDISATWPVNGPVSLEFGDSDFPYQVSHTGIDIADPEGKVGTPVKAFMSGTVTNVESLSWGFGKHVEVDSGHHITSIYGHLDGFNVVLGQQINAGDVIGFRGDTGWSTGPHLHFQINVYGVPVNPRGFLSGEP